MVHQIDLKKSFGESFNRSIVQIEGSIRNPCTCEFVEIKRLNDGSCVNVQVFSKNFKHLVGLLQGCVNEIELAYCQVRTTIILQHKVVQDSMFDVQPLYIINKNHDGKFQSNEPSHGPVEALVKIDVAMSLAQCMFSSKLSESGCGEKSFAFNRCRVFHSDLSVDEARKLNQWDLYDSIAEEIFTKERQVIDRRKFVGFLSCTSFAGLSEGEEYSYANIKAKTSANPALGGGFLCLMGSGCFFSWPNDIAGVAKAFSNKQKVDLRTLLDDSNYRCMYGGVFSTTLGSLIHEMGHIFDLAHTETGLMGNDIDFIHRFFLSENLTEVLPKRIVKSCQLMQQSSRESISKQRFTKIRKPGGDFLDKYYEQKDNDMTFFEPNCLLTLSCHRWFTQCQARDSLNYCEAERKVKSNSAPLRLIEIRELDKNNSMLIRFWPLVDVDLMEFTIPQSAKMRNVSLFVITCSGDILKRDLL